MTLLERLNERWEQMDGAAARKIDRILKERREAAAEIIRLRSVLQGIASLEITKGAAANAAQAAITQ